MVLRVEVPFPPTQPSGDVTDLIARHDSGQILDSGPVSSEWGDGSIVLTASGVVICDTESGEVISISWADIGGDPPPNLDPANRALIPLNLDRVGRVELELGGYLFANLSALSKQLDGSVVSEGVLVAESEDPSE